jgi:hypothetical protein
MLDWIKKKEKKEDLLLPTGEMTDSGMDKDMGGWL